MTEGDWAIRGVGQPQGRLVTPVDWPLPARRVWEGPLTCGRRGLWLVPRIALTLSWRPGTYFNKVSHLRPEEWIYLVEIKKSKSTISAKGIE